MGLREIKKALVAFAVLFVAIPALFWVDGTIKGFKKLRRDGWAYFVPRWAHLTEFAFWGFLAIPVGGGIYLTHIGVEFSVWYISPLILLSVLSLFPLIRLETWLEDVTGREKILAAAGERCD